MKSLSLIAAAGLVVSVGLAMFIHRSPYFWVSAIEIHLAPGQQWLTDPRIGYRLQPPIHVWQANLRELAAAIRREHPQLETVVVHRELPNRLMASVTLRAPVGQLRGRRFYLVAPDGMVLAPGSPTAWEGLPVLLLGSRTAAYQPGQSCALPELRQAVAVLREVQRSNALGRHRVSTVRMTPPAMESAAAEVVTLVLDNGLELRAAPGDLGPRLARLGELMQTKGQDMAQAQYVDLRFDDLVVGLKDEAS
ncbi:MAG: cell division protein FtsQ [Candidatus Omnitrophica bacterium]|nr:cell division protein FtsQ [Candidatus Omnitrophota bacterium]